MSSANGSLERRCVGGMDDRSSKRLCLVCGEETSGFNYGVVSCSACKKFFIKTINNKIEYKCAACNNCDISMEKRTSCRACRFNKCLRVGMKESVGLSKMRCNGSLLAALKKFEPEAPVAATGEGDILKPDSDKVLNTLSDLVGRELLATVEWAQQVSEFLKLCLIDQILLPKTCWAEIMSLALAHRSMPLSEHLKFASNFVLGERQGKALHAEELFSQYLKVIQRLDILQITSDEYLILKALVIVNSDVRSEDDAAVREARESLLVCLHDCVIKVRSKPLQHFSNLLLCLPLLRQVDASVRRFWTNVRREEKVAMNELFVELLTT